MLRTWHRPLHRVAKLLTKRNNACDARRSTGGRAGQGHRPVCRQEPALESATQDRGCRPATSGSDPHVSGQTLLPRLPRFAPGCPCAFAGPFPAGETLYDVWTAGPVLHRGAGGRAATYASSGGPGRLIPGPYMRTISPLSRRFLGPSHSLHSDYWSTGLFLQNNGEPCTGGAFRERRGERRPTI